MRGLGSGSAETKRNWSGWNGCRPKIEAFEHDTEPFPGDSIASARCYTKFVEHYMLRRFPERKVRFEIIQIR